MQLMMVRLLVLGISNLQDNCSPIRCMAKPLRYLMHHEYLQDSKFSLRLPSVFLMAQILRNHQL